MRKFFGLISIIAVLSIGCKEKEQPKTTALFLFTPYQDSPEYLNGQIKSVKELNYWAIEKDGQFTAGNLITQKERDSLNWSGDFTAFYNPDGVIEKIDYVTYDMKTNSWKMEIADNLITKATWIRLDTPQSYYIFGYFQKKQTSATGYRMKDSSLLLKGEITYGEKGNHDKIKNYNSKGMLTGYNTYLWNDKSLVYEVKNFTGKDSLISSSGMEYNDRGFYIKAEYKDGKGGIVRTVKMDYKTFDDKGNWLTVVIYDGDKPVIFAKREYTYY